MKPVKVGEQQSIPKWNTSHSSMSLYPSDEKSSMDFFSSSKGHECGGYSLNGTTKYKGNYVLT